MFLITSSSVCLKKLEIKEPLILVFFEIFQNLKTSYSSFLQKASKNKQVSQNRTRSFIPGLIIWLGFRLFEKLCLNIGIGSQIFWEPWLYIRTSYLIFLETHHYIFPKNCQLSALILHYHLLFLLSLFLFSSLGFTCSNGYA